MLLRDLKRRFPMAKISEVDSMVQAKDVVKLAENPMQTFSASLDIQGTAFQKSVWNALRNIPAGTTASYLDIAKKIGKPKAVRAVAQACGANHISIAIPCHRVVRSDGALSGYRWGVERKKELLEREKRR